MACLINKGTPEPYHGRAFLSQIGGWGVFSTPPTMILALKFVEIEEYDTCPYVQLLWLRYK